MHVSRIFPYDRIALHSLCVSVLGKYSSLYSRTYSHNDYSGTSVIPDSFISTYSQNLNNEIRFIFFDYQTKIQTN